MHSSKALPIAPTESNLTVWTDQAGVPYLVKKQADGSTTFTPLETALAQPQAPVATERVTTYRDPLATLLISLGALLGVILLGYGIGFLAGAAGQRVVVVPSTPACDTHRSSFLFWSSENKECH
ncbi:hypothetical protein H6F86_02055 [Phormidium sp. FACHB-592]|uniref:Uncharacterized protein n=1 Tax=Stenomitos frigidus AS-A4 TaxID=2933935 RepID=A0ABV0KJP7_9CYAN|nr:hypothetical protein [Phormidium sp. FACHB-592]MBD2072690.1 hypothetical protein [Phormidium sp. FACHB-592]